jgi:hypothetical protein
MKKKIRRRFLSLSSLSQGLAHELELLAPTYARLHVEHPALAEYPTLASLLERLTAGPRDDAKRHLLAALVGIRRSRPHRLWVAVLLRAFRPMLGKIWKKLYGSDPQERLALLLLSFQWAILHIDPRRDPIRIGMYVRQATWRRVIVALTKELRWNDIGFGEDADQVAIEDSDATPGDRLRLLRALFERGALLAHVRRSHPGLSDKDHARVCQGLMRGLRRVFLEPSSAHGKEVTL